MNRRTFSSYVVGVATLASVAGCLGSREGSSMFTARSQKLSDGNVTDAFAKQPPEFSDAQSGVVDELLSNGTAVRFGDEQSELFENESYILSNGTYYQINQTEAGVETVERVVLRAEQVSSTDIEREPVSLDYYTDADRRPVRRAVITAFRGRPEQYVFHSPPADTSQLRPEPDHAFVEYQDEYFQLSLATTDVDADRYEYSLVDVATDERAFETVVTDQQTIIQLSSDELTAETQALFDEITQRGKYDASSPFSEAEQDALDLLNVSQKGTGSDERLTRYNQSYYRITVQWSHVD
jgi:hypothetical protein